MKRIIHRMNHLHELPKPEDYDGIEFDIRIDAPDFHLGVGHDFSGVGFSRYLKMLAEAGWAGKTLAINVKSYGCHNEIGALARGLLEEFDYFFFDVPGPEIPFWTQSGLRWFGRLSSHEEQHSPYGRLYDPYGMAPHLTEIVPRGVPIAVIAAGCHREPGKFKLADYAEYDYVIGKPGDLK